ncbi:MAG: ATP-dependent helicase [Candidatus Omnitrophota bacterium]
MKTLIDYKKELNPQQLKAVESIDGPFLVIAGAGSGKTRILVYRVAYLVEKGIDPSDILLLTFTRKASQEMLARASGILDARCQAVSGGTFHSFANLILRKYGKLIDLQNNFTIMDQSDAESVVNLVRKNMGFSKGDNRFPKKKALLNIISKSINTSFDLGLVVESEYPHFCEYTRSIEALKKEYIKYKREKALLDYDDLLVYLKSLLSKNHDIRSKLSKKYKYIMVDEYQDTNKLQADILRLLLSEHQNVMAVGDDSQSIYAFRGANFKNIIDFPKIFKGTEVITLEENYRSVQPILSLTNKVIERASEKFKKALFTRKKGNNFPIYIETENENKQSMNIIDKIKGLCSEGLKLGDIAILFRSGWHSNDLEIELAKNSIPFIKYGGQKFVESSHVKDLLSHLHIMHNRSDEVNWTRVLTLMRGVGPRTAEKLFSKISENNGKFPEKDKNFEKIKDIEKFMGLIEYIDNNELTPLEVIRIIKEYYEPIFKERYDDFNKRSGDLASLEKIASRYENIQDLLVDMALEPPETNIAKKDLHNLDGSRLVLSTIHSAKGLEWHSVFIIHVAEGYIPSYQSMGNDESIEEERRLLYVAMTRAKENLYLFKPLIDTSQRSYLLTKDGPNFTQVSRFLDEGDILRRYVSTEVSDW